MQQQYIKPAGLACPNCATRITVDLASLLAQGKVTCPNCQLELHMSPQKNSESLAIMKSFENDFTVAHQHFEQQQLGPVQRKASDRRRRSRLRRVRN